MLKKIYRLNGKDINFLFRKQNLISWKYFTFFYYKQYPNRKYNQFSLQLSTKLSKKAVVRNFIKRSIVDYINKKWYIKKRFWKNYYKIFIVFNKKYTLDLKERVETVEKKLIKKEIINNFDFSFNNFIKKNEKNYKAN